jgi:hypothetical protein
MSPYAYPRDIIASSHELRIETVAGSLEERGGAVDRLSFFVYSRDMSKSSTKFHLQNSKLPSFSNRDHCEDLASFVDSALDGLPCNCETRQIVHTHLYEHIPIYVLGQSFSEFIKETESEESSDEF